MMKKYRRNACWVGSCFLGAVLSFAFAPTGVTYAQDESSNAHSGMHDSTLPDLSDATEVGESESVITAAGPATVAVSNFEFRPAKVTVPQGETVQWQFQDNTTHTVTENAPMGLFDSDKKSLGDTFSFIFRSAGIYPYHCEIHSNMRGSVQVPIQVAPATGGSATSFTITWSSAPAAAGYVFDVQIKRPGARSFTKWKTGLTARSSSFKPAAGPGKYSFRARLRKTSNNAASLYSPFRTITLN